MSNKTRILRRECYNALSSAKYESIKRLLTKRAKKELPLAKNIKISKSSKWGEESKKVSSYNKEKVSKESLGTYYYNCEY